MKLLPVLLCSLLAVGSSRAQTAAPAANVAAEKSDAKKADAKAKKKEEPPAKIAGLEISRGAKGFLGLELVEGTFKLSFYDVKKKLVVPDVARAALRWDVKYKVGPERSVLNPSGDGKSLSSPKTVRPPYAFKLFITLLKEAAEGEDAAGESFTVDFRG
jgi:hypothetical protein